MKKRFSSNSELAHIWASQSQSEGSANNMFFENKSIYSYGKHFEIAQIFENCVLFTSKNYSITTAKHKNIVYRAISHRKIFIVPCVDGQHDKNLEYYQIEIKDNVLKALSARANAEYYRKQAIDLQKELIEYCECFALKLPKGAKNPLFTENELLKIQRKTQDGIKAREAKRQKQAEKWQKAQAEREAKDKENLEKWLNGENVYLSYNAPLMLRIKENIIETSKGANVPLSEGIALFKAIKQGNNVIGAKVGSYTVDAVESDIIKIGCHNIPLKEAERVFANV